MISAILRRELADHLTSLRFALTLLITAALMAVNGVVFSGSDRERAQERYQDQLKSAEDRLEGLAGSLGELAVMGPGALAKRPSPLSFVAFGREDFLPATIMAQRTSTYGGNWGFMIHMPWSLDYQEPAAPPAAGVVPDFIEVDWVFIVGFCLSLMALLLTYDGICGERREGTLKLALSGPVPRSSLLLGKFAAAWIVLAAALTVGVVLNLVVLGLAGPVELGIDLFLRLAPVHLACLLYLACFVGLGLLVSCLSERPSSALVVLLLVWTVLLVLLPNTVSGAVSYFQEPRMDWRSHHSQRQALVEEHQIWRKTSPVEPGERPPAEFVAEFSDFLRQRLQLDREFSEEQLRRQLEPVQAGALVNRVSPYGILQYALESLAGTGLPRHLGFIEAARRYALDFRRFTEERDQADPDSYHLFGLAPGLSERPVPVEAIPRFGEPLSAGAALADASTDLALLALFALLAFMAANIAFLRSEID